ncbi:amidohydrolase family protein [Bacillus sp. Marseille-P3661]|uniref:amidohydrolase family protein n=1 Tax=Bacillus sp. Marseille-P3661 TaxID=1936234 RepID=UPI001C6448A2|nr:amidohydrolase family protein [Bacillus sp. Marseille-P3661]
MKSEFDTRQLLAKAKKQAEVRGYNKFPIVDVDAHHYENESWSEIIQYIEEPIIKHMAEASARKGGGRPGLLPSELGNQDMGGRISRYQKRRTESVKEGVSLSDRDLELIRRYKDSMGIDYSIIFPTPMLNLGLQPQQEIEVAVARAYAKWITDRIVSKDSSIKTMLYLPFNDPEACIRIVEEFSDAPGVVGFMVTSVRYKPVHHNVYMRLYELLQEKKMPLGFHAGYHWMGERSMEQLNKFISVHALGFTFYNMIHLTNWVINGISERFPDLKVIWIESGLAWVPFMMQRLDHEYMMRSSEAPILTKKPSEYIRNFYFTTQPMERPDDLELLKSTFKAINAETQLMYSSDYPHWDFDLPSTIYDLPFLDEQAKRNILGGNAIKLFNIDVPETQLKGRN